MKRLFTYCILFICAFLAGRAVEPDSVKILFGLNKASYDPSLNGNAASMENFIDSLNVAVASGRLSGVSVYGYASPDGPFTTNYNLSRLRCNSLAEYISRNSAVSLDSIKTFPGCIAWEDLRTMISGDPNAPYRSQLLDILSISCHTPILDKSESDRLLAAIMALDNGRPYKWMLGNLFPKLRFARAAYSLLPVTEVPEDTTRHILQVGGNADGSNSDLPKPDFTGFNAADADDFLNNAADDCKKEAMTEEPATAATDSISIAEVATPYIPFHRLALKTNLLYDAALLLNLEVEWMIKKNWSVALDGGFALWDAAFKERNHYLGYISPEAKYWIKPRAPWHGFYVGVFSQVGWYDWEKTTKGYYGEGVTAGVSVGFMWPVTRALSLEAAVGGGYLYSRVKEYAPMDGHHVYQRTKNFHYFGPLKVKFSLVWRLWDTNKPKSRNPHNSLDSAK